MSKTIIYTCPFVPCEWIAAHGFVPERVRPCSADASGGIGPVPGVCPYARAFANTAAARDDAAGIVVTTVCDQMRRVAEIISVNTDRPVFVMNVPHTWQTASAMHTYISELNRLGRFMAALGGDAPTHDRLRTVMSEHEAQRTKRAPQAEDGIPIAVIGGPIMADHRALFDLIERAGGCVTLDGSETGERTLPGVFGAGDPLATLAEAYFGHIPDPFRRPNTGFYEWLGSQISARGARGIVLARYLWCDNWHAEAERIKETLGLPFLHLDIGDGPIDTPRTVTRVQAFMEALR